MNIDSPFHRFADILANLSDDLAASQPLPASLRMAGDHKHEIYYAPFDHVTTSARVVLVGISPGRVQAMAALDTARRALRAGRSHQDAMAMAKTTASFAGPMRRNLVDLLDHVGVADRLGIESTSALWTGHDHLVHFTSALRYPVFEQGKNFAGSGIGTSRLLAGEVDRWFAAECRALPDALFVPLGPASLWACQRQVAAGGLRATQVLEGLPHPSGANAERIAYFLGRKPRHLLSAKTRPESLDAGRELAMRSVSGWA